MILRIALDLALFPGASFAISWICEHFDSKNQSVVVLEDPTYQLVHKIFEDRSLALQSIPIDDQGKLANGKQLTVAESN